MTSCVHSSLLIYALPLVNTPFCFHLEATCAQVGQPQPFFPSGVLWPWLPNGAHRLRERWEQCPLPLQAMSLSKWGLIPVTCGLCAFLMSSHQCLHSPPSHGFYSFCQFFAQNQVSVLVNCSKPEPLIYEQDWLFFSQAERNYVLFLDLCLGM